MTADRDIRELAQRAELEFHARPHRFRSRAWWSGVLLALGCCGWLLYAAVVGDHRVYEAGALSPSHTFIANDCRQCHTSWEPVRRLTGGGSSVTSIDNVACLKCHAAAEHHPNQIPAHAELSCAECHREHQGKHLLADVTDRHCLRCHQDLKTTAGPSTQFARAIRGFSEPDGHPEFNLISRLSKPDLKSNLVSPTELEGLVRQYPAQRLHLEQFREVLERVEQPKNSSLLPIRDRGEIKFNHAAHLDPKRMRDKNGKLVDLSQNCQACHVPDAAGQYMQPIRYAQHCAQCHPLLFDNQNYPGEVVPHATPDIVRGFLTEKFTLTVLKREAPLTESPIARPIPGRPDRPPLAADQARRLTELVAQAEVVARHHTRIVKNGGGCKLCHTVNESAADATWSIKPTQIPARWMPHSRFDHAAHRMLQCTACHQDVASKSHTGDVMLPGIQTCRACHISSTAAPRVLNDAHRSSTIGATAHDVTSKCVMCHTYHQRSDHVPLGTLDVQLQPKSP